MSLDLTHMLFDRILRGIILGDSTPRQLIPRLIAHQQAGEFPIEKLVTFYALGNIEEAMLSSEHGRTVKLSCSSSVCGARRKRMPVSTVVDVWSISLTQYAPLWDLVPDAELARLTRLRRDHDRNASALAMTVVRLAASEATGCPVESVVIDRRCPRCGSGDHGPLSLTAPGMAMPRVSVSHSDQLVMVALCPGAPVGVDLELTSNLDPDDDLAAVLLSDQQLAAYGSASAPVRSEMLARQWTRKEAVSKAVGVGLAVPLSDLQLTDSALWRPAPGRSSALVGSVDAGVGVADVGSPSGFCAAVAVVGGHPRPELHDAGPLLNRYQR